MTQTKEERAAYFKQRRINKLKEDPDYDKKCRQRCKELHPDNGKKKYQRTLELHPNDNQRRYKRAKELHPDLNKKNVKRAKELHPDLSRKQYSRILELHPDHNKKRYKQALKLHPNHIQELYEYTKKRRRQLCIILEGQIKCRNCIVNNLDLIDLDHINGDGKRDRKRFKYHKDLLDYYIKHPKEALLKLQPLCRNCHKIKSLENGEYSHKPWITDDKQLILPLLLVRE